MTERETATASGDAQPGDLFDVVFRTSADAMVVTRIEDGAYLDVNDAFLRMSRRTRNEVLGSNAIDLDWADPADRKQMVRELRQKGSAGPSRATFRDVNGEPRYGSYSCVVIDFHGERAVLTSIRDLTDLQEAEQVLRAQRARLQMLSDNMPGMMWTTDEDLKITSIAGSGVATLGKTVDELIGTDIAGILPPEDGALPGMLEKVLAGDHVRSESEREGVVWAFFMQPLAPDDAIVGTMGAAMDVTARARASEATRRYAERLHALYDLEQGIRSALTPVEIATQACERTRKMVGCARASVVEFDFEAALVTGVVVSSEAPTAISTDAVLPIDAFGPLDALRRGETLRWDDLASAEDVPADLSALRDEGMRAYARLPLLADGELIGAMNLGSTGVAGLGDGDIEIATEIAGSVAVALHQARLHEQVRSYAAELESTVAELRAAHGERRRLLSRLVAVQEEERRTIAADIHDDPLQKMAAVGLRLDILRRKITDPAGADEAQLLAELVNLTIDRLRHLMFDLWPAALERHGLAAAIRAELAELREERGAAASLEDRFIGTLPVEVRTIAYRICREAISNARRHSKARRVEVTCDDLKGGLLVKIRDDGIGIPPEVVANPEPGHLGLPAMFERADLAGGWLRVHSPVDDAGAGSGGGPGTEIEFWLPVDGTVSSGGD